MLSNYLLAHLDGVCEATVNDDVVPETWAPDTIFFQEEGVTIAWGEGYRMIRVSLFGDAQRDFRDWLEACHSRSISGRRARSNQKVPRLGWRIVFYPGPSR